MSFDQRTLAWAGIFLGGIALLWLLHGMLTPFVLGMILAYFLDPFADRLEGRLGRVGATAVVVAGFYLLALALLIPLVPLVGSQVALAAAKMPTYLAEAEQMVGPALAWAEDTFGGDVAALLREEIRSLGGKMSGVISAAAPALLSQGIAILDVLSVVAISPLVTFYLVKEWDRIVAWVDDHLPRVAAPLVRERATEIDRVLGAFIRGQASVCILLGLFYGTGLTLVGLDFGFALGLLTGLLSFIPFVGMLIGVVIGVLIAILQFDTMQPLIWMALVYVSGQILEGWFLTPKLVGRSVGLHEMWVLFALMAGGHLMGFTGVLVALPVAAVAGVLIRHAVRGYRDSTLYDEPRHETGPRS